LVRHFFGKSPEETKSCAIIAAIHELSGLITFYFNQLELQLLDMPYRIDDFVTRVEGKVAIICETVKLPDHLITSTIHVLSLLVGLLAQQISNRLKLY